MHPDWFSLWKRTPLNPEPPYSCGLTGPWCLPSACHVWHGTMHFLFRVGDTADYSVWHSCRIGNSSPQHPFQLHTLKSRLNHLWHFESQIKQLYYSTFESFPPKTVSSHAEVIHHLPVTGSVSESKQSSEMFVFANVSPQISHKAQQKSNLYWSSNQPKKLKSVYQSDKI